MSQLYDPDLTQWLQLSGEYIGHLRPAEERADWILFLTDEVKAFLPPDEYSAFLREVHNKIDAQLTALEETSS